MSVPKATQVGVETVWGETRIPRATQFAHETFWKEARTPRVTQFACEVLGPSSEITWDEGEENPIMPWHLFFWRVL